MTAIGNQWIRKFGLYVLPPTGDQQQGLDLSAMKVQFRVNADDESTPNTAMIRVFNLARETSDKIQKEYTEVILQAGYKDGAYGTIFQGSIKQTRRGRLSTVDTYLDILCSDGDAAYNMAVVNETLAANSTPQQRLAAATDPMNQYHVALDPSTQATGGIIPRGKVLFGMSRDYTYDIAKTSDSDWSVQNGVLRLVPKTGYLPGDVVVMNAATGMIGMPEQTDEGIRVRCLLNPNITVGRCIRLNNKDINATTIRQQGFPHYGDIAYLATLSTDPSGDGLYRVFVHEKMGDTYGTDWYSDLICLLVNESEPALGSVSRYGGPG